MGSGLRHAASKAAGFDHISRVSVAFPSGACCTSVRLTVAPERRQKKKANPASLRSAAPSKGRGLRGYSLLPLEGGAPKGRRLDGDDGMKKSEEMHLKQAINESTLSTATRSPFPNGEGYDTRAQLSSYRQSEYMHVWKNNTDKQSLPLEGKVPRRGG